MLHPSSTSYEHQADKFLIEVLQWASASKYCVKKHRQRGSACKKPIKGGSSLATKQAKVDFYKTYEILIVIGTCNLIKSHKYPNMLMFRQCVRFVKKVCNKGIQLHENVKDLHPPLCVQRCITV